MLVTTICQIQSSLSGPIEQVGPTESTVRFL